MNKVTKEKNTQILIFLLKAHNIKTVIASPGNTNTAFIGSIQNDPYFTIYSSVDERSAAYMACGLAEEMGEPVVLSCTGATASRNYIPGMTEAYYRKLPVLAVTSMQPQGRIGQHVAQVLDRSVIQNDIANLSVQLPIVKDDEDQWECEVKVNTALLELRRRGCGPVHINLPTTFQLPFENTSLPNYRVIERITSGGAMPQLKGKVAIFIGSHKKWSSEDTEIIDKFCAVNDAVVFCDHTSGYKGEYRVLFSLAAIQTQMNKALFKPDILIHIGEISGDYPSLSVGGKQVWRINQDGQVRDTFRKLRYVFEMNEIDFFKAYVNGSKKSDAYLKSCREEISRLHDSFPEIPLSNIWVASKISSKIPSDSVLHLGILNSLRSWNLFEIPNNVMSASNVGGFGIDGIMSSLVGASLCDKQKLYFCVLGDLAFFYDMNALGNRHVGNNIRILVINNGKGTEFRNYNHHAAYFGESADDFIAAAEHYGNKSPTLIKNYVESLGFEYLSASSKDEFISSSENFLSDKITDKPMVFEVFTDSDEESRALELVSNIYEDKSYQIKNKAKKIIGSGGVKVLKKVLNKN
ncbi:thiamine pyrophosphate-binding protein [Vibrio fluvialis]|uniref:thiamine pyrophosphate-binding protein n=1 Tax=Vibrio fluvialis TaxID=676 RepID=UPI001F47B552|nr:thiamine pyrophosphate-binding protein [Vibrio fluvialis]MCE7650699.1 hypothetical protein [Vibrio fluvialis]